MAGREDSVSVNIGKVDHGSAHSQQEGSTPSELFSRVVQTITVSSYFADTEIQMSNGRRGLGDELEPLVNALLNLLKGLPIKRDFQTTLGAIQTTTDDDVAVLKQAVMKTVANAKGMLPTRGDTESEDSVSTSSDHASTSTSSLPSPNSTNSTSCVPENSTATGSVSSSPYTNSTSTASTVSSDSAPTTTLSGSSRRGIAARRNTTNEVSTGSGLASTSTLEPS